MYYQTIECRILNDDFKKNIRIRPLYKSFIEAKMDL